MAKKKIIIEEAARDAIYAKIPGWDVERVRAARVMVIGAGALGNEVLKNLALLNVGQIFINDFDIIERSNLSRSVLFREEDCDGKSYKCEVAARRLLEINPDLKLVTMKGDVMMDIGLGVFRQMDVVIACLDNRIARLFVNRHCNKVDKTWINGGIMNLAGQLSVYRPGLSCYECELTPNDWQNIRFRMGCTDIARRNSMQGHIPTTPISASVIGAMQTQEALKVVLDLPNSLAGRKFYYDGAWNVHRTYKTRGLRESCLSHDRYEDILEMESLSAEMSLGDFFAALEAYFGTDRLTVELDFPLVTSLASMKTKEQWEVLLPQQHLSDRLTRQFKSSPDDEVAVPRGGLLEKIKPDFPQKEAKLYELGLPHLHVVRVKVRGERHYVELSGDRHLLNFKDSLFEFPQVSFIDVRK